MEQGGGHSGGFTIAETLIVLAISAFLATTALLLVNGRQNKTEYQTAINNVQQQIQQIINETTSGYYPTNNGFSCSVSTAYVPIITTSNSANQGTNDQCLFVGKALRFGDSGGTTMADNSLTVYPLVSNRIANATHNEVTTYGAGGDATVVAIAKGTNPAINSFPPNYTITNGIDGGLNFAGAYQGTPSSTHTFNGGSAGNRIAVFGILESLGSSGASNSSSSLYGLYAFPQTSLSTTTAWGAATKTTEQVADAIYTNQPQPLQTVSLCFSSASTNQSGLITIGSTTSAGIGVTLQNYNSSTTCGVTTP